MARPRRPARPRARPRDEPALRGVVRGGRAGRLPADDRRQRLPPGGLRAVRPEHPARPPAQRRPGVPPPGPVAGANLSVRTRTLVTRIMFDGTPRDGRRDRAAGRRHRDDRGRRGDPVRRRVQHAAAPAAVGRRPGRSSCAASGSRSWRTCPGVGEHLQDHLEVYIQYGSKQPVSMQPYAIEKWRRPFIGAEWLFLRSGPGRDEPLRGRRLRPRERGRRLPEPDVPLPAARDPLRRHAGAERPRLPGPRRADVLRRPGVGADHLDRPARPPGAPLQLPLDRPGPARVGRGDPGRPADPQPAGVRAVLDRRAVTRARPSRPTRRSSTGSARDAETALHPSCTARMGTDARLGDRSADDAASTASTACGSSTRASCRTSRTATSTRR